MDSSKLEETTYATETLSVCKTLCETITELFLSLENSEKGLEKLWNIVFKKKPFGMNPESYI